MRSLRRLAFLVFLIAPIVRAADLPAGVAKVAVTFSGGHDTDARDGGRPIILVASALGVTPEVFRQAFSGVHPAKEGGPSREQAQQNKAALMKVLAPYGITNERLDEVSNYYRYRPQRGELWTVQPASANALVRDGKVIGFELVDAGAGYSSAPTVAIPGFPDARPRVKVVFDQDLKTNGHVGSIELTDGAAR